MLTYFLSGMLTYWKGTGRFQGSQTHKVCLLQVQLKFLIRCSEDLTSWRSLLMAEFLHVFALVLETLQELSPTIYDTPI